MKKTEEKYLKMAADCENAAVYYKSCEICGEAHATETFTYGSAKGHDYADATCTTPKTCKVCGVTEGTALGHSYAAVWSKGEDGHWHECSACGDKTDFAAHDYSTEGDSCVVCGYVRSHVHRLTLVPDVDATCTEGGNKPYYICSGCEDWFEDASGSIVIADKTSVIIAALGHDMTDASCTETAACRRAGCEYTEGSALGHNYENGWTYDGEKHWHKCTRCDAKTGEDAHVPGAKATEDSAQTCTICGYGITPPLTPTTPEKPNVAIPQTGDNSNIILFAMLLIISFSGVIVCVIFRKKRNAA